MGKMSPVHPSLSGWCTVCPSDFWIWLMLDRHEGPPWQWFGGMAPRERVEAASCSSPLLMGTYLLVAGGGHCALPAPAV